MKKPLISVIIPTYNRAKSIAKSVQSVLNQSYSYIEVIIIDDGSTDSTNEVLSHVHDSRVKLISQSNQGVSCARNKGILASKGEWISFLDSDDLWLPKKLETQLIRVQSLELLWCHTDEIWIRNGIRVNPRLKHKKPEGRIYLDCLPLCAVSPSTVLVHQSIFDQIGIFDPLLPAAEDYDLWLRIASRHSIAFCNEFLIEKYGGHKDQLSSSFLGLDRFRVRALQKQLNSKYLTKEELTATYDLFIQKCNILIKGYLKHGKKVIAEYYQNLKAEKIKSS